MRRTNFTLASGFPQNYLIWKEYPLEKWPRSIPFRSPMLKTFSCPYGMGMEWYPTAAREARNMMCHWEGFVPGSYEHTWDDAQCAFWLGYDRSCLWEWVKKNDEKDLPETKMVKEQLRQHETRVWKLMMAEAMQLDDSVTETLTSDHEEETGIEISDDAYQSDTENRSNLGRVVREAGAISVSVLVLSAFFLAFC
ncbi:hypothetical protein EAF04_007100 [Stromatinia cepivora]|nr:hypothetical protein EAF04_007100 [Stromatinia cepivora]